MVPRWRFFASFLRHLFSARHVQHISDLHSKFALRPLPVWKYGRQSAAAEIGCLPYFYTWRGPSANLGLKCAARGSLQMQDPKKSPKIAIWVPFTTLSGYIFATKACIDNRKKIVKQQYLPYMSAQYGKLWPTSG